MWNTPSPILTQLSTNAGSPALPAYTTPLHHTFQHTPSAPEQEEGPVGAKNVIKVSQSQLLEQLSLNWELGC